MRKLFALLLVAAIAVPAWAQYVGMDQQHKPQGVGLTPTIGDAEGVLSVEPPTATPGDTIKTWSIWARGARRFVWRITTSDTVTASPCSLVAVYVSNAPLAAGGQGDTSFIARNANTVGWTVNDYCSGSRLGGLTVTGVAIPRSGSGGATVEAICGGGALRSSWDYVLLVLTRKSGIVGRMDSLRVTAWRQDD